MLLVFFVCAVYIHVVPLLFDGVIAPHSLPLKSAPMRSSSPSCIFGKVGWFQFFLPERCLFFRLLSHHGCDSHGLLSWRWVTPNFLAWRLSYCLSVYYLPYTEKCSEPHSWKETLERGNKREGRSLRKWCLAWLILLRERGKWKVVLVKKYRLFWWH